MRSVEDDSGKGGNGRGAQSVALRWQVADAVDGARDSDAIGTYRRRMCESELEDGEPARGVACKCHDFWVSGEE